MASETVDPMDWPFLPALHREVPPELHVLHGANTDYKSQDLLYPVKREHATFGMPGQRTACMVTQAVSKSSNKLVTGHL